MDHERAEHVQVCFTGHWAEDVAPGLLLGWRERQGKPGHAVTSSPG